MPSRSGREPSAEPPSSPNIPAPPSGPTPPLKDATQSWHAQKHASAPSSRSAQADRAFSKVLSAGVSQLSQTFPEVRLTTGLQSPSGIAIDPQTGALQIDPDYLSTQARSRGLNSAAKMARHLEGVIAGAQPQGSTRSATPPFGTAKRSAAPAPAEAPMQASSAGDPRQPRSPRRKKGPRVQGYSAPLDIPKNNATNALLKGLSPEVLNRHDLDIADVRRIINGLRKNEVKYADVVESVSIQSRDFTLTKQDIDSAIQEFLDFLPARLATQLRQQKLRVRVVAGASMDHAPADYLQGEIRINASACTKAHTLRKYVFHEMAHWLHDVDLDYRKR